MLGGVDKYLHPPTSEERAAEAQKQAENTPAGEATVVEQPKAEPVKTETQATEQGQATEAEEEDDFSPEAALSPKSLAAKIGANVALKAALDASPDLKKELFANSRIAAKAQPLLDMFGSKEEAQIVLEGHTAFSNIRDLLGAVKRDDMASTQAVLNAMLEQDAMRDEEGNPMRDERGRLITGGNTGRFVRNLILRKMLEVEQEANKTGDNDTLAALDHLMERIGLRAPSSAGQEELSEELKAQKAQIEQEQRQLDERKASDRKEAEKAHGERVFGKIEDALKGGIDKILSRATGLTPFTRNSVSRDIRASMAKVMKTNAAFQTELERVERMPIGAKREAAHVALAQRYIDGYLTNMARPILAQAGIALGKKAAQQKDTQAARAEATRSEVKGGTAPTHDTAKLSVAEQRAAIRADLEKKLGRTPTLDEILGAYITPALTAR